eukprot:3571758-Rhodomonas_salina.5
MAYRVRRRATSELGQQLFILRVPRHLIPAHSIALRLNLCEALVVQLPPAASCCALFLCGACRHPCPPRFPQQHQRESRCVALHFVPKPAPAHAVRRCGSLKLQSNDLGAHLGSANDFGKGHGDVAETTREFERGA